MARKLFLPFALSTTLAACGPVNQGIESINQPVVSRTDYVFDVAAPEYGGLSRAEAARLDAWFASMGLSYGDTIYIDDPQGLGDPARRAAVAGVAARYGLLIAPGAPVTQGRVPSGTLRVVVSRSEAYVPGCPNWDRASQPDFSNSTSSNFGCAINSNLAAMVANPEDLVRGRASGANDTINNTRALTSYRAAKPTGEQGLKTESSKGN
jgi:pilus assembly protein CpaD